MLTIQNHQRERSTVMLVMAITVLLAVLAIWSLKPSVAVALSDGSFKVGEDFYDTLEDAAAAVPAGGTIVLTQDAIIAQRDGWVALNEDKAYTLDLNGKTLTADTYYSSALYITAGDITITNGAIVSHSDISAVIVAGGTVTFEDISIEATRYSFQSAVTVDGGTLSVVGGDYVGGESALHCESGNIVITAGRFRAVYGTGGCLVAYGGTIDLALGSKAETTAWLNDADEVSVARSIIILAISVTAPATGCEPDTVAVSGLGSNFTSSAVTWTPTVTSGTFLGATEYSATVTLTADAGYTFTGLVVANINGLTTTVSNNTGSTVKLSCTFATTIPVDFRALDAAIKTAKEKTQSDYTEETWNALQDVLSDSIALRAQENAMQDEVDAATEALLDAIAALEKNDAKVTPPDKKENNDDGAKLPLGDNSNLPSLLLACVLLMSGLVMMVTALKIRARLHEQM